MDTYDVAVIGGGAAGLSAALVLTRARRSVLVIDSGAPRNARAAHMHGYLSRDGLPPSELLAIGRREVAGYGGTLADTTVAAATVTDAAAAPTTDISHGFHLTLDDGRTVTARRLLVATGLRDELADIPGVRERWARDVLHCTYCHGHEVRDQPLGVLGWTPGSAQFAQIVRQWSDDVVFFAAPDMLTADERTQLDARGIAIVEGTVDHLVVDDDRLTGVALADGRVVRRTAVFVPPRFVPHTDLLTALGCALDADGWPVKDATGRTSVAGVWVAGNVANPRAQVITAAGEGSAAAIAINADLVADDVRLALSVRDAR